MMRKAAAVLAAILGIGSLSVAIAQTPQGPLAPPALRPQMQLPPASDSGSQHELTADDASAWLDGFMPYAIGSSDIPGAVVVVVKDGQVLTEKGYGFANVEKKIKVDPKTSMFRPGSISKLFTWTALMQQVEQGKVDLDADVNKYIDFKIPPYQGKPITVRNLMTHTTGFEEAVKDLITAGPKEIPFETLLKRNIPKRIYAPGSTPAYSNYGASLAGYIVERTSGEPFDSYLEHHIFGPLGMQHSTFRQPVPAALAGDVAQGYSPGSSKAGGFEYVNAAPAGALSATGDDMAKFMIAHLQNGQYNGQQILKPQTAQLMHSRANSPFSAGDGMDLGFYETNINGQRVIAHAGDTENFHSDLHLFLDKGVGIFVSLNSVGKGGAAEPLRETIFANFADRYFPEPANLATKAVPAGAKEDAQKLTGVYSTTRGSRSNFLAALDLLGQVKVGVDDQGNPLIPAAKTLGGEPRKWVHVGPMTWRDADGHDLLVANVANGKATRFSYGEIASFIDFDRTPGWRSSAWIMPLLYLSLAILLITALLWPVKALVRRKYKAEFLPGSREVWAYRGTRIASILILAVLVAWMVSAQTMLGNLANQSAFETLLLPLELLSVVAFLGGFLVMLWYAYTAWRGGWRWPGKVWSLALVLAAGTVLYVALVFKLIAFTTNY